MKRTKGQRCQGNGPNTNTIFAYQPESEKFFFLRDSLGYDRKCSILQGVSVKFWFGCWHRVASMKLTPICDSRKGKERQTLGSVTIALPYPPQSIMRESDHCICIHAARFAKSDIGENGCLCSVVWKPHRLCSGCLALTCQSLHFL